MVLMGGEEEKEEEDMESIERSYLELLGAGDFLMVKKEERIEVEEGFLFSLPLPYTSSSPSTTTTTTTSSSSTTCYPQMLHFGGVGYEQSYISTLSPPPPPPTPSSGKAKAKTSRRGSASGGGRTRASDGGSTKETKETTSKKAKPQGTIKVRKEKLGDRINALQQLVSPFGKTDTATVLHEALGYITFLQDQVQVLSSPYMQSLPSSGHQHEGEGLKGRRDLRSRGLCLVPVSCTETVAADKNGADMWSPAAVGGSRSRSRSSTSSSFGSKH